MVTGWQAPRPLHWGEAAVPLAQESVPQEVPCGQSLQAPAPSQSPLAPQVDCAAGVHWLRGSVLTLTGPQTPSPPLVLRAAEQAMQVEEQAVSQQTPLTQKPVAHWAVRAQDAPMLRSGAQTAPLHQALDEHCASVVHEVLHEPVPQAYRLQLFTWDPQVPYPSQRGCDSRPFAQVSEPHAVPEGYRVHVPEPLHRPLLPQELAPSSGHSPSGSSVAAIAPQVPSVPLPFLAAEQAWHNPVQAELQQTPSTQLVLWQSPPRTHALPFAMRSNTSAVLVGTPSAGAGAFETYPPATSTAKFVSMLVALCAHLPVVMSPVWNRV